LTKVYDRLSARSLNGYGFDRQLPKLFAAFCVLMIVIPSLLTGYLSVEPRHNLQDPDKLMMLWLEDSTPENSVIVAGAGKHIMYYCQKGSQRTSIHIIHASRDPSPILDYVLKGYPVFAVLDATTQALYASDFDAFKQRFNLIFVELVPATNIAVFRVYQKT